MGVIATPVQAEGRMSIKKSTSSERCSCSAARQKSPSVRKLVLVKSSTSIYGAGPEGPAAMFTEEMG